MKADRHRHLQDLVAKFNKCRVLVVGDFMYDRFTHGNVDRISPEAPIPVFRVRHKHEMLGGAGNAALNICDAGGEAVLLSVVGDDAIGEKATELVAEKIGPHSVLVRESGRQTTIKQRYIANNQQLLRADTEHTHNINQDSETALLAAYANILPTCQAVLISDYAKGLLTDHVLKKLIELANKAKIPTLVDPKRADFRAYAGATLVKPNKKEISIAAGEAVETDEQVMAVGQKLIKQTNLEYLLVTRGKDGLSLLDKKNIHHIPALQREVWDVSGAGDTVIALMALGMAAGANPTDAATLANIAAGIVVGKVGTATVSGLELSNAIDAFEKHETAEDLENVVTRDQAIEQVARWRRLGLRVGFTNGVFDLLHPGHLSSLRFAKSHCDRLVVGVNSDASVRELKGPERPIQDEQHRAALLAALGYVDLVVIFPETSSESLITAILPDVLIKGGDYKPHEVVGADVVTANGGHVVLSPTLTGFSTTNILATRGISRKS